MGSILLYHLVFVGAVFHYVVSSYAFHSNEKAAAIIQISH